MSDYLKKIYPYAFILLLLLIVIYLFEVLIPFAIAFIIAYLVNPLKIFFDKYLNTTFSSFLSVVFFILSFFSVLILILPIIFYQLQNLIIIAPEYLNEAEKFIKEINNKYLLSEKIKAIDYTSFFKPLSNNLLNSGNHLINNGIEFFSSVFNIILIFIISFYMSLEFNKIKLFLYDFANKSHFRDFPILIKEIDQVLAKFIRGQGLVCVILSIFYGTGLFLVGIKFGIILGIFAGVISFIPFVGAFLGGGFTLILGFTQFGMSFELLTLLLIFVFGQLFESYYLTPKLVGDAIKLNPIWIIFALSTGAFLAGFVGVLISLPVAAVLGVLVRYYFIKLF
ncbi:MAG: AI-2E family transporter [Candidatus Puniceispirillales bacterium]